MPIELPDDLVVAAVRVEKRHGRPERRTAANGDGPGRSASRASGQPDRPRLRETKAAVAEQVVLAGEQAVAASGGIARGVRKLLADAAGRRRGAPTARSRTAADRSRISRADRAMWRRSSAVSAARRRRSAGVRSPDSAREQIAIAASAATRSWPVRDRSRCAHRPATAPRISAAPIRPSLARRRRVIEGTRGRRRLRPTLSPGAASSADR